MTGAADVQEACAEFTRAHASLISYVRHRAAFCPDAALLVLDRTMSLSKDGVIPAADRLCSYARAGYGDVVVYAFERSVLAELLMSLPVDDDSLLSQMAAELHARERLLLVTFARGAVQLFDPAVAAASAASLP